MRKNWITELNSTETLPNAGSTVYLNYWPYSQNTIAKVKLQ